jgi:type I restriction enzyme, S subunit
MWNNVKLKDICKVFDDGNWIESKDQSDDGIRLIQTGNIKFGTFADRKNKARYISEKTFKRLKCKEIFAGDILVSRLPDPVGRACIIPKLSERAITAVDCTIIRLKEICLPEYLNYFMQSSQYFIDIRKEISGATRQRISRKNLGEILIPLPSPAEQQRIITKLDAVFAGIDKTILNVEKKLTNTIKLANTILSKFFEKNDSGWKDIILNDVCKNITDGKHGDCKPQENSGFYFLSAKDVKNNILNYDKARQITKGDFLETHRRTNLEPGDLVVTNSGTIGRMAIVDDNSKTYQTTFQKSVAILKPIHDLVDNKFLFYLLNSKLMYFTNISQGTAQKNLLLRDIRGMKIKLPASLAEQVTISRKCESLLNHIKEIELIYKTKHKNLIQLKQSILKQELNVEFKQAS